MNEQNLTKLRELLLNEFSEEQLAALCQELGINYAELSGVGAFGKTREIIETARSRHLLHSLAARTRELRPDAYRAAKITDAEAGSSARTSTGTSAGAGERTGARTSTGTEASADPTGTIPPPRPIGGPAGAAGATPPMPAPSEPDSAPLQPPASDSDVGRDLLRDTRQTPGRAAQVADKSPVSRLDGRIRAIAVIVGALLLVVALLTILLPPPAAPTGAATATVDTAANTAAPSPAGGTSAPAAITSTVQPTTAAEIAPTTPTTDTQAEAATQTGAEAATPEPTPNISETHPAAEAVRAINDELLAFYQGKATTEDLKKHWSGRAYQAVTTFAYTTLRRTLTVDLTQNDALDVTLRYLQRPALIRETDTSVQVKTREYWSYTNPSTKRSICETRDYTYTMVETDNDYQVRELTSSPVSTRCQE